MCSVFSTATAMRDSSPVETSEPYENRNTMVSSESQEEILHQHDSSTAEGGADSLSNLRVEIPSGSSIPSCQTGPVDKQPSNDASDESDTSFESDDDESEGGITLPEVTISAFTETG